jgi:hypothetical protein
MDAIANEQKSFSRIVRVISRNLIEGGKGNGALDWPLWSQATSCSGEIVRCMNGAPRVAHNASFVVSPSQTCVRKIVASFLWHCSHSIDE